MALATAVRLVASLCGGGHDCLRLAAFTGAVLCQGCTMKLPRRLRRPAAALSLVPMLAGDLLEEVGECDGSEVGDDEGR